MADTISFESIRNGDIKAFETLFKEFYPSMCAIAIRFVSDKDVAQDIVQEVFIKLWEKRTSYEEIPSISAISLFCFPSKHILIILELCGGRESIA